MKRLTLILFLLIMAGTAVACGAQTQAAPAASAPVVDLDATLDLADTVNVQTVATNQLFIYGIISSQSEVRVPTNLERGVCLVGLL